MSDVLFRIVFDGSLTGEYSLQVAKKRFSKLFRLDAKRTDVLFSGKEYVIKTNLQEDAAMKFMIKLAEIGCECFIQEVPDENEPDYEEKRVNSERRTRHRRPPRTGAVVPDRRLTVRRRHDRKYYTDLRRHSYAIPFAFQSYSNIDIDIENNNI